MLRVTASTSANGALKYFRESLAVADYYAKGNEIIATWHGKAKAMLGLKDEVTLEDFSDLVRNINPSTGESLTRNTLSNRRAGYDFTFSAEKAVSIMHAVGDQRILEAFNESVSEIMHLIEDHMEGRVRKGGQDKDRITGNLVWGRFIHDTARPIDGVPDPHLHAHCYVINATFDPVEQKWKAGQFGNLKKDAPYYESAFDLIFARKLEKLGYDIERNPERGKKSWKLKNVPNSVIEKFSRRTKEINDKAEELGLKSVEAKAKLGGTTRKRKEETKDLTKEELKKEWTSWLSDSEAKALHIPSARKSVLDSSRTLREAHREALAHAIAHSFETNSVVSERKLLEKAHRYGIAKCDFKRLASEAKDHPELLATTRYGQKWITTKAVRKEEQAVIHFARAGRGTCKALAPGHKIKRDWLSKEQKKATMDLLKSRNRVMVLAGEAGTGKTSLMQEAIEGIEKSGRKVFTFAPTAKASRGVLRDEGFKTAETLARLLIDPKLQAKTKNQAIWVDEAGLISAKDMRKLFDIADKNKARVILSGDIKQHSSVARGDALRIIETHAGIKPFRLKEIWRQKGDYKKAVSLISSGDLEKGFSKLDSMGAIKEIDNESRYETLADKFVGFVSKGETSLIVSPTHVEGDKVTLNIRTKLKQAGLISHTDKEFLSQKNTGWSEAERKDGNLYRKGHVLEFNQNVKGIKRGERLIVISNEKGKPVAMNSVGKELPVPLAHADRFQVFQPGTIPLAKNDLARITKNGFSSDRKPRRLYNGDLYEVKGFTKSGDLKAAKKRSDGSLGPLCTISKNYANLTHGYTTTSVSSQGHTVDHVILAQSSRSGLAAFLQQFYVSVSRGRKSLTIFTDSKKDLQRDAARSGARPAAVDILGHKTQRKLPNKWIQWGTFMNRLQDAAKALVKPRNEPPKKRGLERGR